MATTKKHRVQRSGKTDLTEWIADANGEIRTRAEQDGQIMTHKAQTVSDVAFRAGRLANFTAGKRPIRIALVAIAINARR